MTIDIPFLAARLLETVGNFVVTFVQENPAGHGTLNIRS